MAESLTLSHTRRYDRLQEMLPQWKALVGDERDLIANLANTAAALQEAMQVLWLGFYLVRGEELVLGPFQGPIACTRIAKGKGVCGQAWERAEAILVPDVDLFLGHIACSSASRSEIVLPILSRDGVVLGVLDVDSAQLDDFSEEDLEALKPYCTRLGAMLEAAVA